MDAEDVLRVIEIWSRREVGRRGEGNLPLLLQCFDDTSKLGVCDLGKGWFFLNHL